SGWSARESRIEIDESDSGSEGEPASPYHDPCPPSRDLNDAIGRYVGNPMVVGSGAGYITFQTLGGAPAAAAAAAAGAWSAPIFVVPAVIAAIVALAFLVYTLYLDDQQK